MTKARPYISLYLPVLYLPLISLYLAYISLYLPISPYISTLTKASPFMPPELGVFENSHLCG